MARYIWSGNRWINKDSGEPMELPATTGFAMPMVRSDIEPYQSVVTGKWITTNTERRDDLKSSGCVPYEPIGNRPKGLTNPKFAKKHNATHLLTEEARDTHKIAKV